MRWLELWGISLEVSSVRLWYTHWMSVRKHFMFAPLSMWLLLWAVAMCDCTYVRMYASTLDHGYSLVGNPFLIEPFLLWQIVWRYCTPFQWVKEDGEVLYIFDGKYVLIVFEIIAYFMNGRYFITIHSAMRTQGCFAVL